MVIVFDVLDLSHRFVDRLGLLLKLRVGMLTEPLLIGSVGVHAQFDVRLDLFFLELGPDLSEFGHGLQG